MKYTAYPEYKSIGVAGCELETLNGFLSGLRYLGQIRSLKTPFMQDLLTGKKRVTALLNDTEEQSYE
ncbi:MAG: hypothetical protein JRE64_08575 [Deltaproteobacteria bacterium]|nr:hypothetical protein [Deltaproteobacteria bacterium]